MSCSTNKLKSHMLFTYKNFMFSDFTWKKNFAPGNGGLCICRPYSLKLLFLSANLAVTTPFLTKVLVDRGVFRTLSSLCDRTFGDND